MSNKKRNYAVRTKTRKRKKAKEPTPRERHIAAIQAEKERLARMTPVGLNRICASFPELRDVIDALGHLVEASDPTAGKLIDPDTSWISGDNNGDGIVAFGNVATHRSGLSTHTFRKAQDRHREDLRHLAYRIDVTLGGGAGKIHYEKPRCQKTNCPEFGIRQPLGTTECLGCGKAFG